jgi:hypothetical protein
LALYFIVRLLTIGLFSVTLFFPLYWVLHPLLGANWGAGVAAIATYVGFPSVFLTVFRKEWEGPFFTACNYLIALAVAACSIWFAYIAVSEGGREINALLFFLFYGMAALYFLVFGRLPFKIKHEET